MIGRYLRAVAAVIQGVLGLLLTSAPVAAAVTPPSQAVPTYNYDFQRGASPSGHATTERGSPYAYDRPPAFNAVDRCSDGVSACWDEPRAQKFGIQPGDPFNVMFGP
jgi:hypothetical protein